MMLLLPLRVCFASLFSSSSNKGMNYPFTLCSLRLTTKPIMTSESIGVLTLCVLLLAVSLLLGKYHSYCRCDNSCTTGQN